MILDDLVVCQGLGSEWANATSIGEDDVVALMLSTVKGNLGISDVNDVSVNSITSRDEREVDSAFAQEW